MKILLKLFMVVLMLGIVSCRDTDKEETAAAEAAIETIDAVEEKAEEISEKIDQEASELEASLKELDSI